MPISLPAIEAVKRIAQASIGPNEKYTLRARVIREFGIPAGTANNYRDHGLFLMIKPYSNRGFYVVRYVEGLKSFLGGCHITARLAWLYLIQYAYANARDEAAQAVVLEECRRLAAVKELWRLDGAARALKLRPSLIKRWVAAGLVPCAKLGDEWYLEEQSLKQQARAAKVWPPPTATVPKAPRPPKPPTAMELAAAELGLAESTLNRYVKYGLLRGAGGSPIVIPAAEIERAKQELRQYLPSEHFKWLLSIVNRPDIRWLTASRAAAAIGLQARQTLEIWRKDGVVPYCVPVFYLNQTAIKPMPLYPAVYFRTMAKWNHGKPLDRFTAARYRDLCNQRGRLTGI